MNCRLLLSFALIAVGPRDDAEHEAAVRRNLSSAVRHLRHYSLALARRSVYQVLGIILSRSRDAAGAARVLADKMFASRGARAAAPPALSWLESRFGASSAAPGAQGPGRGRGSRPAPCTQARRQGVSCGPYGQSTVGGSAEAHIVITCCCWPNCSTHWLATPPVCAPWCLPVASARPCCSCARPTSIPG